MVHDLCTAVSQLLCDDRDLLEALLVMSVGDAAKGPRMLFNLSAETTAEWANLSPTLHAIYVELSRILVAKHDRDEFLTTIVDVPAAMCFWVIEVHCALILYASEHGFVRDPKCVLCLNSSANAAVLTCEHRFFCAGCLRKWEERNGGVLTCPICRRTGPLSIRGWIVSPRRPGSTGGHRAAPVREFR